MNNNSPSKDTISPIDWFDLVEKIGGYDQVKTILSQLTDYADTTHSLSYDGYCLWLRADWRKLDKVDDFPQPNAFACVSEINISETRPEIIRDVILEQLEYDLAMEDIFGQDDQVIVDAFKRILTDVYHVNLTYYRGNMLLDLSESDLLHWDLDTDTFLSMYQPKCIIVLSTPEEDENEYSSLRVLSKFRDILNIIPKQDHYNFYPLTQGLFHIQF